MILLLAFVMAATEASGPTTTSTDHPPRRPEPEEEEDPSNEEEEELVELFSLHQLLLGQTKWIGVGGRAAFEAALGYVDCLAGGAIGCLRWTAAHRDKCVDHKPLGETIGHRHF